MSTYWVKIRIFTRLHLFIASEFRTVFGMRN